MKNIVSVIFSSVFFSHYYYEFFVKLYYVYIFQSEHKLNCITYFFIWSLEVYYTFSIILTFVFFVKFGQKKMNIITIIMSIINDRKKPILHSIYILSFV